MQDTFFNIYSQYKETQNSSSRPWFLKSYTAKLQSRDSEILSAQFPKWER